MNKTPICSSLCMSGSGRADDLKRNSSSSSDECKNHHGTLFPVVLPSWYQQGNSNTTTTKRHFPLTMAACGFHKALDLFSGACCSGESFDHGDGGCDDDIFVIQNIPTSVLQVASVSKSEEEDDSSSSSSSIENRNIIDIDTRRPVTPPRVKHANENDRCRTISPPRMGNESPTSVASTAIFDEETTALLSDLGAIGDDSSVLATVTTTTTAVAPSPPWLLSDGNSDAPLSEPPSLSLAVPISMPQPVAQSGCQSQSQSQSSAIMATTSSRKRQRSSTKHQHKVLRFCEPGDITDVRCAIRRTLARSDMTDQERKNAWLQPDEFAFIQQRDQNLAATIEDIENSNIEDSCGTKNSSGSGGGSGGSSALSSLVCTRGLESRVRLSALRRQSHRLIGLEEVLVELERQWDAFDDNLEIAVARGEDTNPETNPNAVAFEYDFDAFYSVYAAISKTCRVQAEQRGSEDRREANKYLFEFEFEFESEQQLQTGGGSSNGGDAKAADNNNNKESQSRSEMGALSSSSSESWHSLPQEFSFSFASSSAS
eukprot:jgi/Psemu1/289047/fgenesh1_pg.311_\